MSKDENSLDLIERAQAFDMAAYAKLVEIHQRYVFCLCRKILYDFHEAKDISQETFIRVFKYLRSFDTKKGSFKNWLTRIALNLCFSSIKKKKKEAVHLESIPESTGNGQGSDYGFLYPALQELSHKDRIVMVLSLDYKISEISKMLSCKEGTIKSRLFYARKKLKEILKAKGYSCD
ncbi:RNA polymerase sigma factor [Candidatus Riflebacteria bacterium]